MIDPAPLVLGSALLASFITGIVSIATTRILVADQRRARGQELARLTAEARTNEIALQSAQFLDHFVRDGLESIAAHLDALAHDLNVGYHAARRNRAIAQAVRRDPQANQSGGWPGIIETKAALPTVPIRSQGLGQAQLLPFPGDFMQSLLAFNHCLALAIDWLERYPWTKDDKLPILDRFLDDMKTTFAAGARSLQVAAVVTRQLPPRPYLEWFPAVLEDPRLTAIAADLKALVNRQLGGAPTEQT